MPLDIGKIAERAAEAVIQKHIEAAIDAETAIFFREHRAALGDRIRCSLSDYFNGKKPSRFERIFNAFRVGSTGSTF